MKAVKKYKLSGTMWTGKNDSTSYLRFLQLYCIAEIGTTIVQKKIFFLSISEEWGKEEKTRDRHRQKGNATHNKK